MILKNASLKKYNTFGLDIKADRLISIKTETEAVSIIRENDVMKQPLFVLGGGSNILFKEDYQGTIIHPEIRGIDTIEKNSYTVLISAGAGVQWDDLVAWAVENNYYGLENLSHIPGMVGAAPVQNIGAYGTEAKDYINDVRCIRFEDGSFQDFTNSECNFSYRNSIFKNELRGKYLITRVNFRLLLKGELKTSYGSLKDEADRLGKLSLKTVRKAVINIRRSKLPDPIITGNAGSFFKNPVIQLKIAEELKRKYPSVPQYTESSGEIKIAAGWLIEQCGWKGKRIGDVGVHDKQALVIVNYGTATGKQILDFSENIRKSVIDKFGIELEREVEVI